MRRFDKLLLAGMGGIVMSAPYAVIDDLSKRAYLWLDMAAFVVAAVYITAVVVRKDNLK